MNGVHGVWDDLVVKFRILDAQITAIATDKPVIVKHGLSLVVEEGRYETIPEDELDKVGQARLVYLCHVNVNGAPPMDAWVGEPAQIVITGRHENGCQITLAGVGDIGEDEHHTLEISFETAPEIVVFDPAEKVGETCAVSIVIGASGPDADGQGRSERRRLRCQS